MFYTFIFKLVRFLTLILNGRTKVVGKENLPTDEKFVLVAPHRTYLDPVYIAVTSYPFRFSFMAKQELFKIPVLNWIIRHLNAFPVDREKPGVSAIKTPVNYLKNDELNVMIFPSGSRHSTELKGGAITIARLGKSKIVPAVYSGPLTMKDLLLRKQATVKFGEPFEVKRKIEGVDDINEYYSNIIQEAFDELDESTNQ
ncbi:MAG TPA: 1-acyl-sn-glycerol-3-phosphate acyltransferase [Candidatus Atopostipes pullistercoris]|uniref:1-acyl-sn-glycerol-3-phosphate acyltransferase n=1 Tax=Candidatus Atopostipes pullistercoris TaxID=2838467 RepID=A0A9D2G2C2_9LACT|nr:1-acyl-sn-glycerol-3-phosphate acyltransferase [Candidatus Atopostipes pullistercoris]